ncbi:pyridoxal phosphate-dependent aminotransferase [Peptoniphilus sp. KCTC 25270]|uniref:MalY/PatB family protein n=1 Tax=Peptoniphilus sp. KCTC 25270 TaxID=2897414 RepID=UPI001E5087F5|nr:MalY/PatB family protein [Peptoniphilus sp. KCTC 25270]MCD1147547.1 pyridoxal phosphate-dependent aminotransferase [Peptoniphilus sp. KCTC 25270]
MGNKYDFDAVIDRRETFAVKHEMLPKGAPEDSLALWVADMDFAVAPEILSAMEKRLNHGIFGYTMYHSEPLKRSITDWFSRRYQWGMNPRDVFFCPGIVPAISYLLELMTEEGDGVIIQRPVYYPFTNKIEARGRKVVNSPLKYDGELYSMDFEDLEEKFKDPSVKGMILCNPHNPVGRVWTKEELKSVADFAKKYKKWIISDEIHCDLTREGITYTPFVSVAEDILDQIVVCTAPSKTFNLAGLQLSNVVIFNKEWQKKWKEYVWDVLNLSSPNPFAVEATIAAYNEGEEWLEELRGYLDGNFQYVKERLEKDLPKAKLIPSEGTYLAWMDFSAYSKDQEALEKAMHREKLALDEGYIFGEEGIGFERMNLAAPREIVQEAMDRLIRGIKGLE